MESITLQVGDSIVTSGDSVGQVQFAASAESDGGASRYVIGQIYAHAEGAFNASSNPASIVISTSAADNLPASGKLKVTHEGHVLPMKDNAYDLGNSAYRFRNLYVANDVTIAGTGNFDYLIFNTGIGDVDMVAGQTNWNNEAGTLEIGLTNDIKLQVGQTVFFRVKNSTGSTLSKGQAVYASGVLGGGQIIQAAKFVADDSIDEVRFIGLMTDDLANGNDGFVNHFGHIKNVDLRTSNTAVNPNGETWAVGDILFVDDGTPGGLTKVRPKDDIYVALVLADGQNGELFVRITDPGHIDDLHDVNTSGVENAHFLVYSSGTESWIPSNSASNSIEDQNKILWRSINASDFTFTGSSNDFQTKAGGKYIVTFQSTYSTGYQYTFLDPPSGAAGDTYHVWVQSNLNISIGGVNYGVTDAKGKIFARTFQPSVFGGGTWVTTEFNNHEHTVSQISDISTSGLADNNFLVWNSGANYWEPTTSMTFDGTTLHCDTDGVTAKFGRDNAQTNGGKVRIYVDDADTAGSVQAIKAFNAKTTGYNYGINATANGSGATRNVGLYGWAAQATTNWGLWVDAGDAIFDEKVGIGTATPSAKLDVNGSVNVANDVIVGGNVTINGTTVTANADSMQVKDPIITLGLASGNVITNDTYDRGLALVTNNGTAFMGWDNSADKFVMLSSGVATNSSGNYDAGTYGDLHIGGLTATTANFSSTIDAASLGAGEDNSVVILDSDGKLRTDEIDSRVWGTSLVDGAGSAGNLAYWSDANTLTYDGNQLFWNSSANRLGIGTASPATTLHVTGVITAAGGTSTEWNTAYSWGDHSSAGYVTLTGVQTLTNKTLHSPNIVSGVFQDTFTIGSQIFYEQGTNGFSVNEDFDPSNSSTQTAYHFTTGSGRETLAFTLARTSQFTDGFGIYGTSSDNTFVTFGEQSNTKFEWRKGIGIRPLDLDGGTLLMRLNTNGNLDVSGSGIFGSGIDINGAADFSSTINAPNLGAGEDNSVVVLDSDGKLRTDEIDSRVWGSSLVDGAGSANHVAFWSDANTLSYDNGQLYWDSTNNRLGIGTSSPSTQFEVFSAGYFSVDPAASPLVYIKNNTATNSTAGTAELLFKQAANSTGGKIVSGRDGLYVDGASRDSNLQFYTSTDASDTEKMRITSAGNVGIGTTTPAQKLHVASTGNTEIQIDAGTNSNPGVRLTNDAQNWVMRLAGDSSDEFQIRQITGTPSNRLVINTSGNVGIGGDSPTQQLDIRYPAGGGMALLKSTDTTDGLLFGDMAYSTSNTYQGIKHAAMGGANDYMMISDGTSTLVSAANGYPVYIRAGGNDSNSEVKLTSTEVVINDAGSNRDFRVESDNNANMLFVDGVSDMVGIGTGSPAQVLHVYGGTISSERSATAGSPPNTYLSDITTTAASGIGSFHSYRFSTASSADFAGKYGILQTSASSYSRQFQVYVTDSVTPKMIVDGNGKVGIGTTSPSYPLEVVGTAGSWTARLTGSSTSGQSFGLDIAAGTNSSDTSLRIRKTNGTDLFKVLGDGKVGIGVTTPTTQLDVAGSGNFSGDVTISGHLSAATKSFLINHPTREGHKLQYGSLESPYHGVRLTGRARIDNGWCVVKLPEYISELVHNNDDINIQITNIKHGKVLYVDDTNITNNEFTVKTDSWFNRSGLEFYWTFTAVRKDVKELQVEF